MKRDESIGPDTSGYLRKQVVWRERPADVSDTLKLRYALQRRGVALQMAKLCSYKVHQKLVTMFFRELERDPDRGFQQIGTDQLLQADMDFFTQAARLTRAGLGVNADGSLPLARHHEGWLGAG